MASLGDIKRRIKSVKSTEQITKAMEAVSATKMRRSQNVAFGARPFSYAAMEILSNVSRRTVSGHLFFKKRKEENIALIVITSDKGLCGSLNTAVIKKTINFLKEKNDEGKKVSIISVGKYGANFLRKRNFDVLEEFRGISDIANLCDSLPVSDFTIQNFHLKKYDAIYAIYTRFISTLKQSPQVIKILPLSGKVLKSVLEEIAPKATVAPPAGGTNDFEYKFEPSPDFLLEKLLDSLVRAEIYHLILESNASEHSARMVAMKNASENAGELIDTLGLSYNKARQAAITREISEVTSGADALAK